MSNDTNPATIPDLAAVELGDLPASTGRSAWEQQVTAETGREADELAWSTPEGIDVPIHFNSRDTKSLGFLGTYPGITPYLRGPYATMYVNQPWTI
ncbi:MAG: methylmalonyl-CoA mutase family protein, partial [Actinomycetota bacterium]|nr:methylmalonyl-CoA mutase family protein [Actinomycetota bacterium]